VVLADDDRNGGRRDGRIAAGEIEAHAGGAFAAKSLVSELIASFYVIVAAPCRWTPLTLPGSLVLPYQRRSEAMERGYVYILTNDRLNVVYVGSTNDLRKRLVHHKRRLIPGFTKKYNVHRLVYFEEQPSMDAARQRERQLKGLSRAKKEALVQGTNPERRDLADELVSNSGAVIGRDPSLRSG